MGADGLGVKDGTGATVSVGMGVSVGINVGVTVAGSKGVGSAAFGSRVKMINGAPNGAVGVAGEEESPQAEIQKAESRRQRMSRRMLMRVLEILRDEVGDVRAGVLAQDAEEIVGGGNFAAHLREVILEEGEEYIVADADTQVL